MEKTIGQKQEMSLTPLVEKPVDRSNLIRGILILTAMLFAGGAVGEVTKEKVDQAHKIIEKIYEDKKAYDRLYLAHPEAGMEQELKRILEVSRTKNPQILPTRPSRYTPQKMPGKVLLWLQSAYAPLGNLRFNSLAWIDKERVLLVGSEGVAPYQNAMYVWDTAKGTVTPYSDHKFFCYAAGYLVTFPHPQQGPVRWGAVGKQTEVEFDVAFKATVGRARQYGVSQNPNLDLQCREGLRKNRITPLGPASGVVVDLGMHDGMIVTPLTEYWLDRHPKEAPTDGSDPFKTPLLLVNSRFPQGLPLPIWVVEAVRTIGYSEYRRRYVITPRDPRHRVPGQAGTWLDNVARPVYLIGADGSAETVEIRESAGWAEIVAAAPAAPGLVFKGSGGWGNLGGGLFLYDGKEVGALDLGYPEQMAVSADGCKLAYAINNNYRRSGLAPEVQNLASFKFIDFCRE